MWISMEFSESPLSFFKFCGFRAMLMRLLDKEVDIVKLVPWHDIRSTQDHAAHAYEAIDMRDAWETDRSDLPALCRALDQALGKLMIQMHGKDRQ